MIDAQRIAAAVIATDSGPVAMEEGSNLANHWIEAGVCGEKKVVAVECGFVLWLDEWTVVVGVQDLLTEEDGQIVGNEWKTTKEKTRYYNEGVWLDSIVAGSQVAIYGLALRSGTYYEGERSFTPAAKVSIIRVRAVSKSNPPQIWPTDDSEGIIVISEQQLENTRRALLVKASSLRAMRGTTLVPWQLPGHYCTNMFRRQCEYYGDCVNGIVPVGELKQMQPGDPAATLALPHIEPEKLADPRLIVLGASAYAAASECAEKWRRNALTGGGEESLALQTGSCFHAAVAEWYRQIREQQVIT